MISGDPLPRGSSDERTTARTEAASHHLACARRSVGKDRAYPRRTRPLEEDRTPPRGSASRLGRHHLPAQDGLPVEPLARGVPRRLDRASRFPAMHGRTRGARSGLGGTARGVRGAWGRRLGVAGRRRGDGQGAFWGDLVGPNPTDRGKNGVKRSLLVEAGGGPLGVVVAGANVPDFKLLEATLDAMVVERPEPSEGSSQHLSLDKGYDKGPEEVEEAVESRGYTPHIRRIGEEKKDCAGEKRYPARRWVVERTLGWLSKCRAILLRYEKKAANYLGLIKIACILLWYRRQHRMSLLR